MEQCTQHNDLVKQSNDIATQIAVLQATFDSVKDRICMHIAEGEKDGGFRDRVLQLEYAVKSMKQEFWKACIISGLIGGLIGKLTPDLINILVKTMMG